MNRSAAILLKIIIYALLTATIVILQTSLMPRLSVFGVIPDLLVGAVAAVGVYQGKKTGAVFGLISGLTVEALGGYGLSVLPVLYTFIGLICGIVGDNARPESYFAAYLITLPAVCLSRSLVTILHILIKNRFDIVLDALFLKTVIPEYIYTLLTCIPIFIIVKLFELPIRNIEREDS